MCSSDLGRKKEFAWSAWDSYRRLLQSWGMAFGLDRDVFDKEITRFKSKYHVSQKMDFSPGDMKEIAMAYKQLLHDNGIKFEQDLFKQLMAVINLVFASWSSKRAQVYREHLRIAVEWGTAVIIQRMVFDNQIGRAHV